MALHFARSFFKLFWGHIHMKHYNYPYQNSRFSTYSKRGMVATSHPSASQAGMQMLAQGGNAVDAAIATAAMLTVVEPTSNGIGGDAFMIAWINGELVGMNASGRSPKKLSMDEIMGRGFEALPKFGWLPVNIPGVPGAWGSLIEKYGRLSLKEVLAPAITAAREGFVLTPTVAKFWKNAYRNFKNHEANFPELKHWFETFGEAEVGTVKKLPFHAQTLETLAEEGSDSFYTGSLAEKIVKFSSETGGLITKEDLKAFKVEYVTPITKNYKGYDIHEIPPNGDGITALMALGMLQDDDFASLDANAYHHQIEAMKLSFADTMKFVSDADTMRVTSEAMLDDTYLKARRALIGEEAEVREHGDLERSGTVYLATADQFGNMVSYIQSNYMGFGSGVVVPETGIALQNRGHNFSMNKEDANYVGGGKRTFHTIIPGFITKDGVPVGPFGVMGGFMQPQGHLQVAMNLIDFGMNPQSALDAPRWQYIQDKTVEVEDRFPADIARELMRRGHNIKVNLEPNSFGRGQVIMRDPKTGALVGGTESRTDGSISAL